jgi:hypothetical protein
VGISITFLLVTGLLLFLALVFAIFCWWVVAVVVPQMPEVRLVLAVAVGLVSSPSTIMLMLPLEQQQSP